MRQTSYILKFPLATDSSSCSEGDLVEKGVFGTPLPVFKLIIESDRLINAIQTLLLVY